MSGLAPNGTPFAKLIAGTSYAISQLDAGNVLVFTANTAVAVTLPAPGSGGDFSRGFWVEIVAAGSGTVTVTPQAAALTVVPPTINGSTSLAVSAGAASIFQDLAGNWRGVISAVAAGGGITQITGAVRAGPGSGSQAATIAPTAFGHAVVAGAAAGNITVTGIAATSSLINVIQFVGGGTAVTSVVDLTSQFTVSAANTINNTGGTDTTASQLLVQWIQ